jgi:hypothetical protein
LSPIIIPILILTKSMKNVSDQCSIMYVAAR